MTYFLGCLYSMCLKINKYYFKNPENTEATFILRPPKDETSAIISKKEPSILVYLSNIYAGS